MSTQSRKTPSYPYLKDTGDGMGGEDERMSIQDYLHAIKSSIKPMIQQDLKAKDWRAALVSFYARITDTLDISIENSPASFRKSTEYII